MKAQPLLTNTKLRQPRLRRRAIHVTVFVRHRKAIAVAAAPRKNSGQKNVGNSASRYTKFPRNITIALSLRLQPKDPERCLASFDSLIDSRLVIVVSNIFVAALMAQSGFIACATCLATLTELHRYIRFVAAAGAETTGMASRTVAAFFANNISIHSLLLFIISWNCDGAH